MAADTPEILTKQSVLVPTSALKRHPRNARKGDVKEIRKLIRENGFVGALVVQEASGEILVGNHRYQAAVEEGMVELPVFYVEVDEERATKLAIGDNTGSDVADWDRSLLAEILAETVEKNSALLDGAVDVSKALLGTGFDPDRYRDLLAVTGKTGADAAAFLNPIADQAGPGKEALGGKTEPVEEARTLTFSLSDAERSEVVRILRAVQRKHDLTTTAASLVKVCEEWAQEYLEAPPEDEEPAGDVEAD